MTNQFTSKTTEAVNLWLSGDKAKALSIFKTFKMGVTKAEKATLEIAHEIRVGHASFYTKMGYNPEDVMNEAEAIIISKWVKN